MTNALHANALRYAGKPGHVESWFIRANDPASPRAVWLKLTLLAPLEGPAVCESWFIWFDGARTQSHKQTVPFESARFTDTGPEAAGCRFELTAAGGAKGALGRFAYDLKWTSPRAEPLSLFPFDVMLRAPFPKSKALTPYPSLELTGTLTVGDETVKVDAWPGMQGHNWGKEHAFEYAWGHCLFDGGVVVEAFSARVRAAGRTLPRMSSLVVRRGDEEWRFDRTFDFFRQEATLAARRWTVRLHGPAGRVRLRMDALDRGVACLGYRNPNGHLSYCFNTKLAEVLLEVEPKHGPAFRCQSDFGGALELLRQEPEPGVEVV